MPLSAGSGFQVDDMRVIYVVSSAGRDFYSAMTRVSVASLRLTNPRVRIDLVCDPVSEPAMRAVGDPLLDEVVVCDAPPGGAAFRNRFVKTRLRAAVDGPFLFLDSGHALGCFGGMFGARSNLYARD